MLQALNPEVVGGSLAFVIFFGILVSLAIGRRIGRKIVARHGDAGLAGAASLETAVFALLGLLIAFTFSGALTRFDSRRALVVDEANAIGTAYLRIDLLPSPAQPRLRDTFREYLDSRIATYRKLPDLQAAQHELARSQALQADIWAQAVAATRLPESRSGTDVLVMPALNAMFDITTVRVMATQMHPPIIIFVMLAGFALASALLAGYQGGHERADNWVHQLGFAGIVAFTVYVILDIEYPRMGWIRIDDIDQVLVSVRAGMK